MQKEYFLLEDKVKEIESKFLLKNGWLKIYESITKNEDDSSGIYCCLVATSQLDKYANDYSWPILMGSEGKPSVYGNNSYKTYADKGLEPFLFYKYFSLQDKSLRYFDVSEEFVLYFKLYEEGSSKDNRVFYYINDYGEMDEVIIIEQKLIRIKLKYIKEYITIRKMNFVVCFDYMRLQKDVSTDWNILHKDDLIKGDDFIYSHLIRNVLDKTQSWIMGKLFIKPDKRKKTHFDRSQEKNQEFIIGYDEKGNLLYENCGNTEGNHFKLTYFKKEVLNKYYNEPTKYKVDGFEISSKFFYLKIDNNINEYVPVFLIELRMLPPNEQLHWKQYNIPPKEGMGMSNSYYRTMIEGNWAEEPETVDLFFKDKYIEFNNNWEKKFGWKIYKQLSAKDEYLFNALHLITTNNIKAFCEQTLTIVKLTIDRLNEKELAKGISLIDNVKGIGKFEAFLKSHKLTVPDMFEFLRNLQDLRSGLIAHSFSESNKDCKRALIYFGIKDDNLIEVLENILSKSIFTFNTLGKYFALK